MKIRRVNRYYCDHCKKSTGTKAAMVRHEERCTANPNRVCHMCQQLELAQADIELLKAVLPHPDKLFIEVCDGEGHTCLLNRDDGKETAKAAIEQLRAAAGGCPACILAALRQRYVGPDHGVACTFTEPGIFDYHAEMKAAYEQIGRDRLEEFRSMVGF
jgi:hypothetical protein